MPLFGGNDWIVTSFQWVPPGELRTPWPAKGPAFPRSMFIVRGAATRLSWAAKKNVATATSAAVKLIEYFMSRTVD
jgi:hypothetical protein